MRRAVTAVLNQEKHQSVEGEKIIPPAAEDKIQRGARKTHRRRKDGEEEEEEIKSGRKNLRRQSECGRKKKDRCFRHGGKEGEEIADDERKFERDAVCVCWLFGVK